MLLGGLQKITLIDYPGKLAATVFTLGCNFFCPFCHNPSLVLVQKTKEFPLISQDEFFWWLEKRVGLLEGVCITGGEPTIQEDLPEFIKEIKDLGFRVKLDTNGSHPEVLEKLINDNLVDYLAMDIKAPLEKYSKFYQQKVEPKDIERSVQLIQKMPDYEFRTTVIPLWHKKKDFLSIGRWLEGSKKYVLQQFRPANTLEPKFSQIEPYPEEKLREFCQMLRPYFETCELRI